MKTEDYCLIETTLQDVIDSMNEMYELVDTSYNKESSFENENDVLDWNKKLDETMEKLRELQMELIFTFEMKDENTINF